MKKSDSDIIQSKKKKKINDKRRETRKVQEG